MNKFLSYQTPNEGRHMLVQIHFFPVARIVPFRRASVPAFARMTKKIRARRPPAHCLNDDPSTSSGQAYVIRVMGPMIKAV